MPAYDDELGLKCAEICANMLGNKDFGNWRFYFFAFTVSNVIFLASPLIIIIELIRGAFFRGLRWFYAMCLAQIISWPILLPTLLEGKLEEIQVGYYIWLSSALIITCSVFKISSIDKSNNF